MKSIISIFVVLINIALLVWIISRRRKPMSETKKRRIEENIKKVAQQIELELGNDKERTTENEVRNLIIELKLPPIILDLFDGNCTDEVMQRNRFNIDYTNPYAVLHKTKNVQDHYQISRYKPILAYAHATIFAYDIESKKFVTYDIEYFREKELQHLTWDGLFVTEILRWWEYEVSDEDILHIGNLFGLRHTKEMLESIITTTNGKGFSTTQAVEKWKCDVINQYLGTV